MMRLTSGDNEKIDNVDVLGGCVAPIMFTAECLNQGRVDMLREREEI
jgi:hypothetical protein